MSSPVFLSTSNSTLSQQTCWNLFNFVISNPPPIFPQFYCSQRASSLIIYSNLFQRSISLLILFFYIFYLFFLQSPKPFPIFNPYYLQSLFPHNSTFLNVIYFSPQHCCFILSVTEILISSQFYPLKNLPVTKKHASSCLTLLSALSLSLSFFLFVMKNLQKNQREMEARTRG